MDLAIEQVLSQVVAFLLMLWILKIFFWKPILSVMEERKRIITSEFDLIEQQKDEVNNLAAEYQSKLKKIDSEARSRLQQAIEKGQHIALGIEVDARAEATKLLNKAGEEIKKEIAQAKIQLKDDIVKISLAATQKLIKQSLSAELHKKIIQEAIEQIDVK